jgi:hypothetical protein
VVGSRSKRIRTAYGLIPPADSDSANTGSPEDTLILGHYVVDVSPDVSGNGIYPFHITDVMSHGPYGLMLGRHLQLSG